MRLAALLALTTSLSPSTAPATSITALVEAGDVAWSNRAAGHRGDRARPAPIEEALTSYSTVLEAEPGHTEARWKLLRTLYFQGEHVVFDRDLRLTVFERGRAVAEEGLDLLAAALGGRESLDSLGDEELAAAVEDRAQLARAYFWATVHWGLWGRTRGKLAAARAGVADRVRDYARRVIALDPTIENAGGLRVLGRLHHEAPRIPFVTGWVDKATALTSLERAHELAPSDLLTRVYLGELLIEHFPERRAEGWRLIEGAARAEPNPRHVVEDLRSIDLARARLAER